MSNWNKIAKVKTIIIIILSFISLFLNGSKNIQTENEFHFQFIIICFLFIIAFFVIVTKFWSLFGVKFDKPNWNEKPISFNFSRSLNFFHFVAFWFITSGVFNILFFGVFYFNIHIESLYLICFGTSILIGIQLSTKLTTNKQ